MASAIFKRILENKHDLANWRVESAGTWAIDGQPASTGSQQVMKDRGMDISEHRSRGVDQEILALCDLILAMESGHKEALRAEFPEFSERVFMLSEMVYQTHDVADPIGRPYSEYEKLLKKSSEYYPGI
jgi:protein-tyrosine phosphatase